jgi:hypothetical protein
MAFTKAKRLRLLPLAGVLAGCIASPTPTPLTTALTMISEDAEPSFVEIQEDTGLQIGVWGISTQRGDGVATVPAGNYRVIVRDDHCRTIQEFDVGPGTWLLRIRDGTPTVTAAEGLLAGDRLVSPDPACSN